MRRERVSQKMAYQASAVASISQRTFLGSVLTATQLRAGLEVKYLAYTSLKAAKSPISARKQLYYATEKGQVLNQAHLHYDDRVFGKTLELMKDLCTEEEIETCFHVLEAFVVARRQKHYRSKA